MNKIGIIQGRLSPRPYPLLQEFPLDSWKQEFTYAKELGFDFIEWIFEENNYKNNPIWTPEGREEIKKRITDTGVPVGSVCADFFLENPFFRSGSYSLEELIDIGASVILLPVLENAELTGPEDERILVSVLNECLSTMERYDVKVGMETELEAKEYYRLAAQFKSDHIGAYYDTGNCAFHGYDMKKDMEVLNSVLVQVHVKDRTIGGGSVYLGTGDTNFSQGIPYLQHNGYQGNYVLQSYFEDDHLGTAKKGLEYIRSLINE